MMKALVYLSNVEDYKIALSFVKSMQNLGILSEKDVKLALKSLREKYVIKPNSVIA